MIKPVCIMNNQAFHQEIYQLMKYKRDELSSRLSSIQQDFSSESSTDDVLFAIAHQTKVELADVKTIMNNIEQGSFGLCQLCNEPIEVDSLKNNPFEKICQHCKTNNVPH
jgi:DnaK suppressor protein